MHCSYVKSSGKRCGNTTDHKSGLCWYHLQYGQSAESKIHEESVEGESSRSIYSGWLYVLANSHMPGLLKIGRTDRSPRERIDELSAATGVPTPFILIWDEQVSDSLAAEREIHRLLEAHRISGDREFFQLDPRSAIEMLSRVAAKFSPLSESKEPSVAMDFEKEDEIFISALMLVKRRGEIDPRSIRMAFGLGFEESRAVFEKLKLLGAIDASGRAQPNYRRGW